MRSSPCDVCLTECTVGSNMVPFHRAMSALYPASVAMLATGLIVSLPGLCMQEERQAGLDVPGRHGGQS